MSKKPISNAQQYLFAEWNLTKLKGIIEALYFQSTITQETKNAMMGILSQVWGYARNAAYDLEQAPTPTVLQED